MIQNNTSSGVFSSIKLFVFIIILPVLAACSGNFEVRSANELPVLAQKKYYNVLAMMDTTSQCLRQDLYYQLDDKFGERLLTWRVQEEWGQDYVYAFPLRLSEKYMQSLEEYIESYPEDTDCEMEEGFDSLFPLVD